MENLSSKINIIEDKYTDFISTNMPLITSEIFTGDTYIKELNRIRTMDTVLKSYLDQFSRIFNEFFSTDTFKTIVLDFQKLIISSIVVSIISGSSMSNHAITSNIFGISFISLGINLMIVINTSKTIGIILTTLKTIPGNSTIIVPMTSNIEIIKPMRYYVYI